jgi:hypothetical protein
MNIRYFVSIILITLSFNICAQSLQVGYVHSVTNRTIGTISDQFSNNGIQVGVSNNTVLQNSFSINYGLMYSYLNGVNTVLGVEATNDIHNIDVPVRILVNVPFNIGGIETFVFGGPNFSYTLSNTRKYSVLGQSVVTNLYDNKDYSRFNLQLGLGLGFSYKNYSLRAGYDWGILDQNKSENIVLNTNAFIVSLGFSM